MRTPKMDANYCKLETEQRFVLFARALARDDQPELNRLVRSAPLGYVTVPDYHLLGQAFDHLAHVYVESQLDLLAHLFLLSCLPRHDHTHDARVSAWDFIQRHQAWLDFCRWLDVPPELIFNYWPPSEPTLRAAEAWARYLVSSDKPTDGELAGLETSQELLSIFQKEFDDWAGRATQPAESAVGREQPVTKPAATTKAKR